jgi:hypothetical protein
MIMRFPLPLPLSYERRGEKEGITVKTLAKVSELSGCINIQRGRLDP